MADYWYVDRSGNRQGPVDEAVLKELLGRQTIAADALVWTGGMAGWQPAREVTGLEAALPPVAATVPAVTAGQPAAATTPGIVGSVAASMTTTATTWGLFWRFLLVIVGTPFIIPIPWVTTLYWRYVSETTVAPDGRPFRFEGRPGDIWLVLVAQGILFWIGQIPAASDGQRYGQAISVPLTIALGFFVLRWVCRSLWHVSPERRFAFCGTFWPYVGWIVLLSLSLITIIGWAWVFVAYLRWFCRNIDGDLALDYRGSGWGLLWRAVLFTLGASFIIPIPWLFRWLYAYVVTHVTAAPRTLAA